MSLAKLSNATILNRDYVQYKMVKMANHQENPDERAQILDKLRALKFAIERVRNPPRPDPAFETALNQRRCRNCMWWNSPNPSCKANPCYGLNNMACKQLCLNIRVNGYDADGVQGTNAKGDCGIETGPEFGCVHFDQKLIL